MSEVTAFEVILPTKAEVASASAYRRTKPRAEIRVQLDSGDHRSYYVPSRVARAFESEGPSLPCPLEEFRDSLSLAEAKAAFANLTEMLSRRDHSTMEARDKLSRAGYHAQAVAFAIASALDRRFLDDDRFSRYFIEERLRRGWGRIKIESELRKKGVSPDSIPGYPEEFFSHDDDLVRARELLDRTSVPETRAYEKLVRRLMGKGFSYSAASSAVRERLTNAEGE